MKLLEFPKTLIFPVYNDDNTDDFEYVPWQDKQPMLLQDLSPTVPNVCH